MTIAPEKHLTDTERELLSLQLSPEERVRRYGCPNPNAVKEWLASGPPATPEELREMEELLRLREQEREVNLAREAGLLP
jgi:hypothetical protein